MELYLKNHPFYANEMLDKNRMICPLPWSHTGNYRNIYYKDTKIENRRLFDIVNTCLSNRKYSLGYAIILNTIESIGITYIYRFCDFAREMNNRQAILTKYYSEFNEILVRLIMKFNRDCISLDSYECLIIVYKKHMSKYTNFEFNNLDEDYRSDLLNCMESMKFKINFVDAESQLEPLENLSKKKLFILWQNYVQNIINIDNNNFFLKSIDGIKAKNPCYVCKNPGNMVINKYSFLPCGHGWCCLYCLKTIDKCPFCQQNYSNFQVINIMTPSLSYSKNDQANIRSSIIDSENSRCLDCFRLIKEVVPNTKYIIVPCGHGWYCNDCSMRYSCIVCDKKVEDLNIL
ncbi:uncharacterized protein LOC126894586 isoform X2 [Daktulosphaira vitifoliae]|nr:uncharacterized protein LOC126894586 isoform X2 [Daktulosphaira vitifoliae]